MATASSSRAILAFEISLDPDMGADEAAIERLRGIMPTQFMPGGAVRMVADPMYFAHHNGQQFKTDFLIVADGTVGRPFDPPVPVFPEWVRGRGWSLVILRQRGSVKGIG